MRRLLNNSKIYTHHYHKDVTENAIKAGVVSDGEVWGMAKTENRIMGGRRLSDKNKGGLNVRDKIFLYDLQTDDWLLKQEIKSMVARHSGIVGNQAHEIDVAIDRQSEQAKVYLPNHECDVYKYALELTQDGVYLQLNVA